MEVSDLLYASMLKDLSRYRKSYSQIWHTQKYLQKCRIPPRASSSSQSGEGTIVSGAVSEIQWNGQEVSVGEGERSSAFSGGEEGNVSALFRSKK